MKVGEQSQAAVIWDEETGVYIFFTPSTSADEPGKALLFPWV